MASKSKAAQAKQSKAEKSLLTKLLAIPLAVLFVKLVTISNIPGNVWLGADGENYIAGLEALIQDGIFSKSNYLSYWPAGYPLLMYVFSFISAKYVLVITIIAQSFLYAFASWFFVNQLTKTKLKGMSFIVAMMLGLNPTLTLSSLTIGYESISASIFILSLGLLISEYLDQNKKFITKKSLTAAGLLSISSFVQPRFLLSSILFFIIWAAFLKPRKFLFLFLVIQSLVLAILPAGLVARNIQANDFATISTNLGITMNLGAGPNATGAYIKTGYGVPCSKIEGDRAEQDTHLRNCVISWYLKNPSKSLELFYNKARFFWSPWSGPAASGSMARNPWLKISPLTSIASESQSGNDLVYGGVGKIISWFWIVGNLLLLFFGVFKLWQARGLARLISVASASIVLSNWIISVGTLGDHRQRLPIMSISLFLQVVGLLVLIRLKKYRIIREENNEARKPSSSIEK